jgi:hypothetical protein
MFQFRSRVPGCMAYFSLLIQWPQNKKPGKRRIFLHQSLFEQQLLPFFYPSFVGIYDLKDTNSSSIIPFGRVKARTIEFYRRIIFSVHKRCIKIKVPNDL